MTIKNMEQNLIKAQQHQQKVRIQSQNQLYVGNVKGINHDTLNLQTAKGEQQFDMNKVDNYKLIK